MGMYLKIEGEKERNIETNTIKKKWITQHNFYTHKICNYCFDSIMGLCNFVCCCSKK